MPTGFPSAGTPRGGPPGFASRPTGGRFELRRPEDHDILLTSVDQGDFPALGSHAGSSYASQAQPGQYLSQQPLTSGLQPPGPPPGISAPGSTGLGNGSQPQTNGSREEGDDFPALGGGQRGGPGSVISDGKDRVRDKGLSSQERATEVLILLSAIQLYAQSRSTFASANVSTNDTQWSIWITFTFQLGDTLGQHPTSTTSAACATHIKHGRRKTTINDRLNMAARNAIKRD